MLIPLSFNPSSCTYIDIPPQKRTQSPIHTPIYERSAVFTVLCLWAPAVRARIQTRHLQRYTPVQKSHYTQTLP
eukprot:4074562-Pyramimonas_sp.AAC.1